MIISQRDIYHCEYIITLFRVTKFKFDTCTKLNIIRGIIQYTLR